MPNPKSPGEGKRSVERVEAERMYLEAKGDIKLVEIAKTLGITDSKIRKWKSTDNWDGKLNPASSKSKKKQVERSTSKTKKRSPLREVERSIKKKGGQPGNKNAVGNETTGNPAPVPPIVHGGYSKHYWNGLDDDEKEILNEMSKDPLILLTDTIKICTLRERKLLMAIKRYTAEPMYVSSVITSKQNRKFKNDKEREEYERRVQEKIDSHERMPGEVENVTTTAQATVDLVQRLQRELTTVSNQKTRAIEALSRLQAEKEGGNDADALKAWMNNIKMMRSKGGEGDGT